MKCRSTLLFTSALFLPVLSLAQGSPAPSTQVQIAALQQSVQNAQMNADNAWMLVSSALVLLMTGPGLALFYGGLVRRKNILGTMMQSFAMMCLVTILWAVLGYSLAFGHGNAFIGGFEHVFLRGVGLTPNTDYAATIPEQTYMIYQLMFAIITPALITGAFAERMKFSAMALFLSLWSLLVYSPMAHMVWGVGGLLNANGGHIPSLDFAGGTVVHITSGVSALVTALYLGKRAGYPHCDQINPFHADAGHNCGIRLARYRAHGPPDAGFVVHEKEQANHHDRCAHDHDLLERDDYIADLEHAIEDVRNRPVGRSKQDETRLPENEHQTHGDYYGREELPLC